ncbi:DNA-directed RNA polymerase subunit beta', partial [Candidatus Peregrinibacteria bacterium]|nr:DNA-directed RNA polymerase subunit beta' [Candidatus Peregrinibacteria bacterium]
GKKDLSKIVKECFEKVGSAQTAILSDNFKEIGFRFATKSGISFSQADMAIPKKKEEIIEEASEVVKKINNQFWKGLITDEERYMHTINIWSNTKSEITNIMVNSIGDDNNIYYMIDSGARGNWGQITQLCGMKGLVANPAGKTIELPIKSNLKEGFTILEYFIATHGGRKGKSDTALKTAEAGYLTRRLVDACQDIVIKEEDCGTKAFHRITREESEELGEKFENRIYGRTLAEDVVDPKTGEIVEKKDRLIEKETINLINQHEVNEVTLRSVMTCKVENGICVKCYGKDLGTNKKVRLGTAVGIIAAQSIGEPGTQLTMRTFHMGGVAEGGDITQGLTRVEELFEARTPKSPAIISEIDGTVKVHQKGKTAELSVTSDEPIQTVYTLHGEVNPVVKKGDKVKPKMTIAKGETQKGAIKAVEEGKVTAVSDEEITVISSGPITKEYKVPQGKSLLIKSKDKVTKGQPLTTGHLDLKELMSLTDIYTVEKYIVNEVQTIYVSQGQSINDKHVEIIAKQMLSKIRIIDNGDSNFLPGEVVDFIHFNNVNEELTAAKKKTASGERLLLGLTRIALQTNSWLSAASFQETIRVLVEASTTNKLDQLEGLKENVIIGKLIPAGDTYIKKHPELGVEIKEKPEEEKVEEESAYENMLPMI